MKPEDIKPWDWARILAGNVPGSFYIEVVIRTVCIFVLLLIAMRLLGRRMAAQLNRTELIALFSLAAAIGVPIQAPDRGLLPAVVIAFVVIGIGRLLAFIAYGHQRVEAFVEGSLSILIEDGVIQMKALEQSGLTVERLLARLRTNSVKHLGEVKRLYIEANGLFSLVKQEQPVAGLTVLPANDAAFLSEQTKSKELVCKRCGNYRRINSGPKVCDNCRQTEWLPAIE